MRYLALLYGEEDETVEANSPAFWEEVARYERFGEVAGDAIVAGEALEPAADAITVRHGPNGAIVTDGVFAEGAEVVGGVYVLEAADLDAAIDLARQLPAAETGAVELRPLVEWSEEPHPVPEGARRYLALLVAEEGEADRPGTPAWDAGAEEHARFGRDAGEMVLGGGALYPAESGTVVRVRGGETLVTDGVFAEGAEVVGGLYVLWAGDRDAAVDLAARIPIARPGRVELRPIVEFD